MALNTGTNSGAQDPGAGNLTQPATTQNSSNVSVGNVQPVVSSDLLKSQQGISLSDTPVTTVNLSTGTSSTVTQPVKPHHINAGLAVFSICLFVLAVILFWYTSRPVKSTT